MEAAALEVVRQVGEALHPVAEAFHSSPVAQTLYHAHEVFQEVLSVDHNLIPHMAWEQQAATATGLSLSQFRFTLALFSTVLLAPGIRLFRSPTLRHLYAIITGVLIIYYPFGSGIIHVAPMAVAAYVALLLVPRYAGVLSWCTVFPYLIYLHVVNASGESWKSGDMDFTGGAMVAVLKLISICVCRQDSFRKNKEDLNSYQSAHQLTRCPSPLEFLSYLVGMGNLLAGPFFEFSDYKAFIELKGPWDPKAARPMPSSLLRGLAALAEGVWHMGVYLGLTLNDWNMDHYHSAWYYSQPFLIKCVAFCVIGLVYQLRYYFTWKITESSYALAGLDFVGYDADGKPQWGRCRNCSFLGVWLADSARNVPLNWNIATGTFLRRYVYERVAPRKGRPGFQSLLFTQLISAVWHGLYPGYVSFFVGTAVWIYFSQILYKAEGYMPTAVVKSLPFRAIKILWTTFVLNYMAASFQLLDFAPSMRAYASVGYFPFIVMLVVNVLGSFLRGKRSGGKGGERGAKGKAAGAAGEDSGRNTPAVYSQTPTPKVRSVSDLANGNGVKAE
ncbi:hypothetical protein HYH03_016174 [Edaphochlamys debaryana]|uniref:Uncharacterized protein n=1 Tax=Edaphochlamys debaryana TaxID=47281 RepID=A0A835XKU5_9CHLO|nr:hypothetical protein HYH03_016174 [Edaphochlamys debaryana]|eukprot:KAG2485077.1 hypothetical protein HYH03_016174 [Edaphochlamys debaryana]